MGYRLGIDIGGTFTDFVLFDEGTGSIRSFKHLTSRDITGGLVEGLRLFLEKSEVPLSTVREIRHATTLGSNAIIERKGARTALVTTRGFRDLLHIQRAIRYQMFNLHIRKVEPLVPRHLVFEVTERTAYDGTVVTPLNEAELAGVAARLKAERVDSVAIVFLHSYAAPEHERRARELLSSVLPNVAVTISSDVSLQGREYERTSTTVANAYLRPMFRDYLDGLTKWLREHGFCGQLTIMQSNGGLARAEQVYEYPVRVVESGPAAGVLAAIFFGRQVHQSNLIAFDMGGTTAKAGLVEESSPQTVREVEVAQLVSHRRGSGIPLDIPAIDLEEIGAGGGSIAGVRVGTIKVGPESAAADPAPMCYRRGGTEPTVTDANLILGYLNKDNFLGGEIRLDEAAARAGIEKRIAVPLGLDLLSAAWGIHHVVTMNMAHAVRQISVARGRDPRDYTLVSTGGAGPTHACRLARELGIRRVLVPVMAGVASAIGLLVADGRHDVTRTFICRVTQENETSIRQIFAELAAALHVQANGHGAGPVAMRYTAAMRYQGQGFEVNVPLQLDKFDRDGSDYLMHAFRGEYRRLYGDAPAEPVQGVHWTATAVVSSSPLRSTVRQSALETPSTLEPLGTRLMYMPEIGGQGECPVYDRAALPVSALIAGPCVVEDLDSSTVLLPGDRAFVDATRNLHVDVKVAEWTQ